MNNTSEQNLKKLLNLIDELCSIDENQWFKEALIKKYSKKSDFQDFPEFLKHQKKQFRLKARTFYSSINDKKLKKQLVDDYVEMMWNQSVNNVDRFMLFSFYQLENLLNYYLNISNAHNKIYSNKNYYTHSYNRSFTVVAYDGFFYKAQAKAFEKVNIWSKLTFWMIDSNSVEWESKNHFNISNLINIRNSNSHRNSKQINKDIRNTVQLLKVADFSYLGFYLNVLKYVLKSLDKVSPEVKKIEIKKDIPKLKGLTIQGKIDLK